MSLYLIYCLLVKLLGKLIDSFHPWRLFLSCSVAFLSTYHTIVLCLVDQQYPAPPPPPPPPPPMFGCHNPSESCSSSQALLLRNYNRYSQPSSRHHPYIVNLSAGITGLETRRPPMIFKERELSLILCCKLASAPSGLGILICPEVRCCPLGARQANTNSQWSSAGVSAGRTDDKRGESHGAVKGKLIMQELELGLGMCSFQALILFPACTITPSIRPNTNTQMLHFLKGKLGSNS